MKYNIPLKNLGRQHEKIRVEIDDAIKKVIDDSAFIAGKYVEGFEKNFASYCGAKHCIGVSSGTNALLLSYLALGIKSGDEVIAIPSTFIATTGPLGLIGAKPVFVDIDPQTYLINPDEIVSKITPRTKAIAVVHLFGQPDDMGKIMEIAKKYNLKVVEDCAHAHGAEFEGKKVGTFGDMGAYSFNPGKNLGALGDAGCVLTDNDHYADILRKLRDQGRVTKHEHEFEGLNARMNGIQGAVLSVKLNYLDSWVKGVRSVAEAYNRLLPDKVKKPHEAENRKHVYHQYVIETNFRDELFNFLKSKGIHCSIHYPVPLHIQKAYNHLGFGEGSFPVVEKAAGRILSLPIFPEITDEEVEFVAHAVSEFMADKA